jgi:hypothetical protein
MAEPAVPVIVPPPAVEEGPDVVRALPSPAASSASLASPVSPLPVSSSSGSARPAVARV